MPASQSVSRAPADRSASRPSQNDPVKDNRAKNDHGKRDRSPAPLPDVYQQITDRIAAEIEAGVGAFRMPWHMDGAAERPVNAVSKLPYRGANTLLLWLSARQKGYTGGEWATYKQWQDKGAQVRKGEKAAHIVFWKFSDMENGPGEAKSAAPSFAGDPADSDFPDEGRPADRLGRLVLARTYPVFNADQVDGYERKPPRRLPDTDRISHAEEFLQSSGVTVIHGGGRAFYSPAADHVVLPQFERFKNPLAYYAVRAHETVHATGHPSRLARQFDRYGTAAYAMEELTAELGAAFLCADLGLTNYPRKDHAQYAATWVQALKADPRALFTAASRAQAAADWLHDQHVARFLPEPDYNQVIVPQHGAFQRAVY